MTGRELILYILENGLEDEPVMQGGKFVGFMSGIEAAAKFNVGMATIDLWASKGLLPATFMCSMLIPVDAEDPRTKLDGRRI